LALLVLLIAFPQASLAASGKPLKIGFVLAGPTTDQDWSYSHDQGRKYLEATLKDKVQTFVAERVPETADAERVMEKMIAQGAKLIFSTGFGYLEPVLRVAAKHPDVVFMQCERSCPSSATNVGSYFAVDYAPLYVAGIVAGKMTKKAKLGFVAGHPIPAIVTGLNVFTMGARSVNPKVRVEVVWTNNWFDPPLEAEATKGLIESGADVVACTNSPTVVKTCEQNGIYSVGCNVDHRDLAPKGWLTGQCWNWGSMYVEIAQSVLNGTWKKCNTVYPLSKEYSHLASFGPAVPVSVRKEASDTMKKIEIGDIIIFKGPIKDRSGCERVHPGQTLNVEALKRIDWVVEGVEGPLPKG
jgi:basic membrane protein A